MVACMAVMARETWTDERLDDLTKRMDKGFDATKVEIRDLRVDTSKGFEEVKGEVRDLRTQIGALNNRFDSMQQTMIIGFITLFVTIVASVIGGVLAALALS
jgi:hypothetical protein